MYKCTLIKNKIVQKCFKKMRRSINTCSNTSNEGDRIYGPKAFPNISYIILPSFSVKEFNFKLKHLNGKKEEKVRIPKAKILMIMKKIIHLSLNLKKKSPCNGKYCYL
ncbi:hypothetical protein BpHYR1_009995 [Brachionus plicatilis]|uniref:Uncharacterized protein n=1 Tax=Brachionus plicatilis TaxID=10195 RepID=A0A3M7PDA0_BRAPC|nr:hypothetical protein BpHYR1_009995 [Brachionus plicatilis]